MKIHGTRDLTVFALLISVGLLVGFSQPTRAYVSTLSQFECDGEKQPLVGEVTAVRGQEVKVKIGEDEIWLEILPGAQITRNGVLSPLASLAPLDEGVFYDARISVDNQARAYRLRASFSSVPVRITSVDWFNGLVTIEEIDSTNVTVLSIRPSVSSADLKEGAEGLAILSWNNELKHFIPYQ